MSEEKVEDGPVRLSLKQKEIEVVLEGVGGDSETYTLVEMTALQRDKWLQRMQKRMKKGTTIITDFIGIEADLVAECIRDGGQRMSLDQIKEWPASTQRELSIMCRKLNALDRTGDDDPKN